MLQLLSFPLFLHLVHSQQRICDPVGSGVYAGGRGWHDQTTIPLWWGRTRWWYLNTYFTSVSYVVFFFFALKPDKFKIWDFFFLLSVPTNFMVTLISIYEVTMLLPCLSPAHTAINWMPSGRGGFAMFAFIPWVFSALKAEALHVTEWMKQKFNFPALHPSFSTDKVYMLPSAPCFPHITAFLFSFWEG